MVSSARALPAHESIAVPRRTHAIEEWARIMSDHLYRSCGTAGCVEAPRAALTAVRIVPENCEHAVEPSTARAANVATPAPGTQSPMRPQGLRRTVVGQ